MSETTTTYRADVTDPISGRTTALSADTPDELEQLIDQLLADAGYPDIELVDEPAVTSSL